VKLPKWAIKGLKWAGKQLINAAREEVEKIIDDKKSARGAGRNKPKD
jgi:hypothetical protein